MESSPYVDYVRIEIRIGGRTEVLELLPEDWSEVRAQVVIDEPAELSVYGEPSLVRPSRQQPPCFRLEASGGVARLTVNEPQPQAAAAQ